jgi:two-component system NarL family sensor kinase
MDASVLSQLGQELLQLQQQRGYVVSRELQDNIAQMLAVIMGRIAVVRGKADSPRVRRELAKAREAVGQALVAVDDLSRSLRPELIDKIGLAAAIERHACAFRDRVKLDLQVRVEAPSAENLDGEAATHLFRIVQEALHNIEKHAQASEVRISLLERDKLLCLEIADNGCSFTPGRAATVKKNGHLGLVGMRERAEMLGGKLEIHAQPGNGTIVKAAVPVT